MAPRFLLVATFALILTACASSSSAPPRSEFEDVPLPAGLTLDNDRTTIIESPNVKAARLYYRSRLKPDSLAVAFRTSLEANGWRHVSSTTSADKGIVQVYEKPESSLQVRIYEGLYYTWTEVSTARVLRAEPSPQPSR